MTQTHCHCGLPAPAEDCCLPIIEGTRPARTPEELMRARYTAHCLRDYAFLVQSTHPDHLEGLTEEDLAKWATHVTWTDLTVHSATPGATDDEGFVSFTAAYTVRDTPQELREDASFAKKDGRWYYVDGKVHGQEPYRRDEAKVGRNDPCPCGSGKKYKKCCGA